MCKQHGSRITSLKAFDVPNARPGLGFMGVDDKYAWESN
jgi:hypothetical protein